MVGACFGLVRVAFDGPGDAHISHIWISLPARAHDKRIACDEEFSDSEDEGQGGRRNAANFKKSKRVKTEEEKDGEEKGKRVFCRRTSCSGSGGVFAISAD